MKKSPDRKVVLPEVRPDAPEERLHRLPRCIPSERLRCEEQTEGSNPLWLLLVEVLHADKEYRKASLTGREIGDLSSNLCLSSPKKFIRTANRGPVGTGIKRLPGVFPYHISISEFPTLVPIR